MKQEAGHLLKLNYDWLSPTPDSFEMKQNETPAFKDWTLLQIEGEEPQPPPEVQVQEAPKGKKPPAGKGKPVVEEITDNRPRTITLRRDFGEEQGAFAITHEVATDLTKAVMKIEIVDSDSVVETIKIPLSEIIWPTQGQTVSSQNS